MRGGWSGFGMVTVGIHPTDFELNPTKIPPGGVVQNCLVLHKKHVFVVHPNAPLQGVYKPDPKYFFSRTSLEGPTT